MKITLEEGHPIGYVVRAEDGREVLVQSDWDYPSLASNFGWKMRTVQKGRRKCDHDSTDGTIDCTCGVTASQFITEAAEWLSASIGAEAEDSGYFEWDEENPDEFRRNPDDDWEPNRVVCDCKQPMAGFLFGRKNCERCGGMLSQRNPDFIRRLPRTLTRSEVLKYSRMLRAEGKRLPRMGYVTRLMNGTEIVHDSYGYYTVGISDEGPALRVTERIRRNPECPECGCEVGYLQDTLDCSLNCECHVCRRCGDSDCSEIGGNRVCDRGSSRRRPNEDDLMERFIRNPARCWMCNSRAVQIRRVKGKDYRLCNDCANMYDRDRTKFYSLFTSR